MMSTGRLKGTGLPRRSKRLSVRRTATQNGLQRLRENRGKADEARIEISRALIRDSVAKKGVFSRGL